MANQSEKIRSINDDGWDGLEAPAHLEPVDTFGELDRAYYRLFNTPDGVKVLDHLKVITLNQPCWVPGSEPSYGYAREGQNSIIREIIQRIRRSQNGV